MYDQVKHSPKALKELSDLVSKYSKDLVEIPGHWRRAIFNYNLGNVSKGLADNAGYLKDFVYSIPGRVYPYLNGVGSGLVNWSSYLKYATLPFGPFIAGKDLAVKGGKYVLSKFAKPLAEAGWKIGTPFLYVAGAYALYKTAKYLLNRRRRKKERSEFDNNISHTDLENVIQQLRDQNNMLMNQLGTRA